MQRNCDSLTASSPAYQDLVQFLGNHVPIVNVIDSVVEKIVADHQYKTDMKASPKLTTYLCSYFWGSLQISEHIEFYI